MPGNILEQILRRNVISGTQTSNCWKIYITKHSIAPFEEREYECVFLCPPYLLVIISGKCDIKGSKRTRDFCSLLYFFFLNKQKKPMTFSIKNQPVIRRDRWRFVFALGWTGGNGEQLLNEEGVFFLWKRFWD